MEASPTTPPSDDTEYRLSLIRLVSGRSTVIAGGSTTVRVCEPWPIDTCSPLGVNIDASQLMVCSPRLSMPPTVCG
ncbi:hypothetical protein D9M70_545430 [compost metagenome]